MTPDPNIADPNITDAEMTDAEMTDSSANEVTELNDSIETDADGYEDVVDAEAEAADTDAGDTDASDTEASDEIEAAKAAFDADSNSPESVAATSPDEESLQQDDKSPQQDEDSLQEDSLQDDSLQDDSLQDEEQLIQLAVPFVGQWNQLISTSNWEKGRIISDWRAALIESGVDSSQYSDEAWTRRVGGVTAPHVGRLRRVHDRFASTYQTYEGLYWSHFLAAMDWDDAPLWLEGASKENWSVAGMREQRWQAHGAVESNRPTNSQIVEVDLDEDVEPTLPAEGGGRTKEYGDEPGTASGPVYEAPDFGDEDELMSLAGAGADGGGGISAITDPDQAPGAIVQPFAGLPELPDDLSDAVESFKLALLRHKTSKWEKVSAETIEKYLQAFAVLLSS